MKWEVISREEQETIINVDYFEKKIAIFTNRKQVAERLKKKLGEPTTINCDKQKIYSVSYERNLFDNDVTKFFSKGLIIGSFRKEEK